MSGRMLSNGMRLSRRTAAYAFRPTKHESASPVSAPAARTWRAPRTAKCRSRGRDAATPCGAKRTAVQSFWISHRWIDVAQRMRRHCRCSMKLRLTAISCPLRVGQIGPLRSGKPKVATMPEQWLPVVGWEGLYEVSDHGNVKSLARTDRLGRPVHERILKPKLAGSTGKRWCVQLQHNGIAKQVYIHNIMLEAFVGPRPDGMIACHKDDTTTNLLSNLRWDTYSANAFDQVRNGRHARAQRTHCKRSGHPLTEDNVIIERNARICRQCRRDDWQAKKNIINARRREMRKVG